MSSWRTLGGSGWGGAHSVFAEVEADYTSTGEWEQNLANGEVTYTSYGLLGDNQETNYLLGRSGAVDSSPRPQATSSYNNGSYGHSTSRRHDNEGLYSRHNEYMSSRGDEGLYSRNDETVHSRPERNQYRDRSYSSSRERNPSRPSRPTSTTHRSYTYSPNYPAEGVSYEDYRGYIQREPVYGGNPFASNQGSSSNAYEQYASYGGHDNFGDNPHNNSRDHSDTAYGRFESYTGCSSDGDNSYDSDKDNTRGHHNAYETYEPYNGHRGYHDTYSNYHSSR